MSLKDLLVLFWEKKVFILMMVLVFFVGALGYSFLISEQYSCKGTVYYTMSVMDFKMLEGLVVNSSEIIENNGKFFFVEEKNSLSDEDIKGSLQQVKKAFRPLYSFSREDMRLPGSKLSLETNDAVFGLSIDVQAASPEKACDLVLFWGRVITDRIVYKELRDYISKMAFQYSSYLSKIDNERIDANFSIVRLREKLKKILEIKEKYPIADKLENYPIMMNVEEGNRFLNPSIQAVGIESEITDLEDKLIEIGRELRLFRIIDLFFDSLITESNDVNSGFMLFSLFKEAKVNLTKELNPSGNESELFVYFNNMLSAEMENIEGILVKSRFVSDPKGTVVSIGSGKGVIVSTATFIAIFFSLFSVLTVDWLKKNGLLR